MSSSSPPASSLHLQMLAAAQGRASFSPGSRVFAFSSIENWREVWVEAKVLSIRWQPQLPEKSVSSLSRSGSNTSISSGKALSASSINSLGTKRVRSSGARIGLSSDPNWGCFSAASPAISGSSASGVPLTAFVNSSSSVSTSLSPSISKANSSENSSSGEWIYTVRLLSGPQQHRVVDRTSRFVASAILNYDCKNLFETPFEWTASAPKSSKSSKSSQQRDKSNFTQISISVIGVESEVSRDPSNSLKPLSSVPPASTCPSTAKIDTSSSVPFYSAFSSSSLASSDPEASSEPERHSSNNSSTPVSSSSSSASNLVDDMSPLPSSNSALKKFVSSRPMLPVQASAHALLGVNSCLRPFNQSKSPAPDPSFIGASSALPPIVSAAPLLPSTSSSAVSSSGASTTSKSLNYVKSVKELESVWIDDDVSSATSFPPKANSDSFSTSVVSSEATTPKKSALRPYLNSSLMSSSKEGHLSHTCLLTEAALKSLDASDVAHHNANEIPASHPTTPTKINPSSSFERQIQLALDSSVNLRNQSPHVSSSLIHTFESAAAASSSSCDVEVDDWQSVVDDSETGISFHGWTGVQILCRHQHSNEFTVRFLGLHEAATISSVTCSNVHVEAMKVRMDRLKIADSQWIDELPLLPCPSYRYFVQHHSLWRPISVELQYDPESLTYFGSFPYSSSTLLPSTESILIPWRVGENHLMQAAAVIFRAPKAAASVELDTTSVSFAVLSSAQAPFEWLPVSTFTCADPADRIKLLRHWRRRENARRQVERERKFREQRLAEMQRGQHPMVESLSDRFNQLEIIEQEAVDSFNNVDFLGGHFINTSSRCPSPQSIHATISSLQVPSSNQGQAINLSNIANSSASKSTPPKLQAQLADELAADREHRDDLMAVLDDDSLLNFPRQSNSSSIRSSPLSESHPSPQQQPFNSSLIHASSSGSSLSISSSPQNRIQNFSKSSSSPRAHQSSTLQSSKPYQQPYRYPDQKDEHGDRFTPQDLFYINDDHDYSVTKLPSGYRLNVVELVGDPIQQSNPRTFTIMSEDLLLAPWVKLDGLPDMKPAESFSTPTSPSNDADHLNKKSDTCLIQ